MHSMIGDAPSSEVGPATPASRARRGSWATEQRQAKESDLEAKWLESDLQKLPKLVILI